MDSTRVWRNHQMDAMTFSQKLSSLADERDWNQADFLRALKRSGVRNVSVSTVSNWFNGKSRPEDTSVSLAVSRLFGVPLEYLVDDEMNEPPPTGELPDDEDRILRFYRSLKRTGALNEDLAISGLASVARTRATLAAGEPEWETVGVRDRTAGDNANLTRQNRQAREDARKKAAAKEEAKKGRK